MGAKRETFTLDARLVRMVLRVSPELQEDLITLSERLFDETKLEYSYAAIIRGLISSGSPRSPGSRVSPSSLPARACREEESGASAGNGAAARTSEVR